jgi:AcrR family transcriptional regulator
VPKADPKAPGTRDAILAAARQVLLDDGLTGVTTRRVANVAGVNQALVHYHFGSIENLLLDVLETVVADTRRSERIFYSSGDLLSKWRKFTDELLEVEVPNGTTKIWLESVVMASSTQESRDRYVDAIATSTHERLLEVVRSGLPEDTPPSEVEGLTALIMSVRKSISVDALVGWNRGHVEMLKLVDSIIADRMQAGTPGTNNSASDWPRASKS